MLRYRISLFVFIAVGLVFSACHKESYPVAGKDAFQDVSIYESRSGVLLDWLKKGYQDMVVVNIDYHDDVRLIPDEKIRTLSGLAQRHDWTAIESSVDVGAKSLYTDADFLYAAFRLGIMKKLYWVAPSRLLDVPEPAKGIQLFLKAFGYPDEVINSFKKDGKAFTGNMYGLEVTISSIQGLPKIKEPVLFTVDSDYFSRNLLRTSTGELQLLTDFFIGLGYKDIEVRHLSISSTGRAGFSDVLYRHVADELRYLFQNPDAPPGGAFPGHWRLRASGLELLREGQYKYALQTFDDALETFPDEPSLFAGRAVALALLGRDDEAFGTLEKLSGLSREYDAIYLYVARRLAEAEEPDRAERYVTAFLEIHPDSVEGLMEYGALLYNSERDAEALEVYQRVLEYGENAWAIMYAGDALMHLGRFDEALEYYTRGVMLVNDAGYLSMRDFPEASRNINILRSHGTVPQ